VATPSARPTWLVLAYQLPARPPHLRVRIWRRLQQVGAAVLRNSMYVLPNRDEAREDLEWVRSEIVAHRGQASLLEANALDGDTDTELIAQMKADRDAEYRAFMTAASRARDAARKATPVARAALQRGLRKLKEQLASITRRDYVDTPSRRAAEALVAQVERELADRAAPADASPRLRTRDFKGRLWRTRPGPGIDRMASAWFIRRFIDARARFAFATSVPARDRRSVPFDMADVEFGHHGAHCTFETLVHRFGIAEPPVRRVAEIVHDLDLKETRFGHPEGVAVGRLVDGLRASGFADGELLEHGMTMIEALYQSFVAESGKRRRRT
jgi:hypothetical protein